MLDLHEYRNVLYDYLCRTYPPVLKHWISPDNQREAIFKRVSNLFFDIQNSKAGERVMKIINAPGAAAADYGCHLIDLAGGRFVISSVKFISCEGVKSCYIQIYEKNFEIGSISKEDILKIAGRYEIFKPESIRFFENEAELPGSLHDIRCGIDTLEVAGPLQAAWDTSKPAKYGEICMKLAENMDFYDEYSRQYDLFHAEDKRHKSFAVRESTERLKGILEKDMLCLLQIKGEAAGLIAIEKSDTRAFEGYLVVEKILYEKFRGKGFGFASQKKVFDMLKGNGDTMIYGTIHPGNTASLKTAAGCGRKVFGANYLIYLTK